jgi:hypothetical protein
MFRSAFSIAREARKFYGIALGREAQGSLKAHLARSTLRVIIKAISMGLSFAIGVLLARWLGVREFGLYAFGVEGGRPNGPCQGWKVAF